MDRHLAREMPVSRYFGLTKMTETEVTSLRDVSRLRDTNSERRVSVSLDDMETHFRGGTAGGVRAGSELNVGVLDFSAAGNIYGAEVSRPAHARDSVLADLRMMPLDAQAAVRENMSRIENPNRVPPLSSEQVNRIYAAAGRLLSTNNSSSPLSIHDRRLLVMGIVDNAANPRDIDQGAHDTCNVTTLEERLNTINPALAAELVAHVGLTGHYRAPDGRVAQIDPRSIQPDPEGRVPPHFTKADGLRNYASQLFQLGVINDHWQRHDQTMRFLQVEPTRATDTGDRLMQNGRVIANEARLDLAKMEQIGARLGFQPGYLVGNASARDVHGGVVRVRTEAELQRVIEQAQRSSSWPMIIGLEGDHRMFGPLRISGGIVGHVVSIVGYDRANRTVQISDQRGRASDLPSVPISELFRATIPPPRQRQARPQR